MKTIKARNVNEAFRLGMMTLARGEGVYYKESRNGPVVEAAAPVATTYVDPRERVLTIPERDANPFFHFFESLWMLAGANDVDFPSWFNSKIGDYSDDGQSFYGAYGYRWRQWFGQDQLERCILMLRRDPDSRRVVLGMWDPRHDLGADSKDIPCNNLAYFKVTGKELRMTVCCRSNDAIWGAYGANAVHFSMLHEYVAGRAGYKVGAYTQVSDSLHAYVDNPQWNKLKHIAVHGYCPYVDGDITPYPLFTPGAEDLWLPDLMTFMEWVRTEWGRDDFDGAPDYPYANSFFKEVAEPMFVVWVLHKSKATGGGLALVDEIGATDWRLACREWLERRCA